MNIDVSRVVKTINSKYTYFYKQRRANILSKICETFMTHIVLWNYRKKVEDRKELLHKLNMEHPALVVNTEYFLQYVQRQQCGNSRNSSDGERRRSHQIRPGSFGRAHLLVFAAKLFAVRGVPNI